MKKHRTFAFSLAILGLTFSFSMSVKAQEQTADDPDLKYATELLKPGTEAPDFALPTPAGDTVSLSSLRGRYVVLDFWASWCPDCRKDAPEIVRLHDMYKDRGVEFVGVSFDTDKNAWTKAVEKLGIKYTQVSQLKKWKTEQLSQDYHVKWIPSIYLIDPQGRVVLATVVSDKIAAELAKVFPACETPADACSISGSCCGR